MTSFQQADFGFLIRQTSRGKLKLVFQRSIPKEATTKRLLYCSSSKSWSVKM
jgi:hypothetical protein